MVGVVQKQSWKTSAGAIAAILASLSVVIKSVVDGNYDVAMAAAVPMFNAIGLMFARDSNVTSEQAGAK